MRVRVLNYAVAALALVILAGFFLPAIIPHPSAPPYEIVESLDDAVSVVDWDEECLHLTDGRNVRLPGIAKLPLASEALSQATQRGVEIDAKGNVFGLVRVHHWCGNDPCRNHLARVNLAYIVMFFRQGELVHRLPDPFAESTWQDLGVIFSESGLRVGHFLDFSEWSRVATEEGI